jgi:hypothetical protein
VFVFSKMPDLRTPCVTFSPTRSNSPAVTVVTYSLQTAYFRYKTADAVLCAEVKERVELCRCSPSGLSCRVIGCTLLCGGVNVYPVVCMRRRVAVEV